MRGKLVSADEVLELQSRILGLLELKSAAELKNGYAHCLAQTLGEHLAANSMLFVRKQYGLDAPVLLSDGSKYFMASSAEDKPDYILFSSLQGGASSAALLMEFLLHRSQAALKASSALPPSKTLATL